MIDVDTETLVPLNQVPKLLPPRPNGKPIHISAIYRWVQRGIRGMKLESVRIGGTTYTSREALQRFADAGQEGEPVPVTSVTPARRRRQVKMTSRQVETILGSRAK